ncbi:MAG: hypothetical protein K2X86_09455 [Cytophagaceae bacterium]|nr:hypothetical protein [Cytophagaceae bacterium]
MKTLVLSCFIFFTSISAYTQSADSLKQKLSKEWKLKKYEQFGLIDDPIEEQKNDKIILKNDLTCTIVENGKTYTGAWSIDKTNVYVMCKLNNGAVKRQYKIISVKEKEAIFEYQSPDLIRTKYHLAAE